MSCKTFSKRQLQTSQSGLVSLAMAFLLVACVSFAGDPIQFSGEKGKAAPQQERKLEGDSLKSLRRDGSGNPFNGLTPHVPQTRVDPKDQKRLKKERDDQKNWLLKDPDEKDKEDDPLGGDEFSLDGIFAEDEGLGATFAPLVRNKSTARNSANMNQQAVTVTEDTDVRVGRKDTETISAHTSRELNLKNLLDTTQTAPGRSVSAEPSLFDFLRENSAPKLSRDQVARKEQFEKFLNSSPNDSMQPRMMDPINFAPDLTQQRINPVLPSAGPSALDMSPGSRPHDFSAKPDFNLNSRPAAGWSDLNRSPTVPAAAAPTTARPTILGNGGSMFNNNLQRRPGT